MDDRTVTVYWRPGCGFCSSLLRDLARRDVAFDRVNIWEDPEGAAVVRSVAGGNETVPTVRVGNTALVNPTGRDVMSTLAEQAPDLVPDGYEPPQPSLFGHWLTRVLGG